MTRILDERQSICAVMCACLVAIVLINRCFDTVATTESKIRMKIRTRIT